MAQKKQQDIRQRLNELQRQSREQHMELAGVDVKALRDLEQKIDKQFTDLAESLKKELRGNGSDIAERHKISQKRTEALFQKEIEGLLPPEIFHPTFCFCLPFISAANVDHGNEPAEIDPPADASVTFESTDCIGHPYVDAKSPGAGGTSIAELTSYCRFSFIPSTDGIYCIRPLVYMNGHFLAWTWGACNGTGLGTAIAQVKLQVQIDQLSLPVKTIEHTIVDEVVSGGSDTQGGFAYDSAIDGGASTSVILQGGHEAVVWVKCICYVKVIDHGRAWVDMQTSPQFYFKVPTVRWGKVFCWPWWRSLGRSTALPSVP